MISFHKLLTLHTYKASHLFNGGFEVNHTQLQNTNKISRLKSPEMWIFLKLSKALATNKVYALLQKLLKSICLGCAKTNSCLAIFTISY